MLTNIENYSWLIILPVFGLLFTKIWGALKKYSSFSESMSFVIALCVSMLCVVSIIGGFPQDHEDSQEITVVRDEGASSQEHQQHKFRFILLPYMALMMSFLLLLMIVKIGLLADGVGRAYRPSYNRKDKVNTIEQRKVKNNRIKNNKQLKRPR